MSKPLKGSKVLILGIAYKKNVDDVRESPALEIVELFRKKGAEVLMCDPHVDEIVLNDKIEKVYDLSADIIKQSDISVVVTNHDAFDYDLILDNAAVIVDSRNALKGVKSGKCAVVKI